MTLRKTNMVWVISPQLDIFSCILWCNDLCKVDRLNVSGLNQGYIIKKSADVCQFLFSVAIYCCYQKHKKPTIFKRDLGCEVPQIHSLVSASLIITSWLILLHVLSYNLCEICLCAENIQGHLWLKCPPIINFEIHLYSSMR